MLQMHLGTLWNANVTFLKYSTSQLNLRVVRFIVQGTFLYVGRSPAENEQEEKAAAAAKNQVRPPKSEPPEIRTST